MWKISLIKWPRSIHVTTQPLKKPWNQNVETLFPSPGRPITKRCGLSWRPSPSRGYAVPHTSKIMKTQVPKARLVRFSAPCSSLYMSPGCCKNSELFVPAVPTIGSMSSPALLGVAHKLGWFANSRQGTLLMFAGLASLALFILFLSSWMPRMQYLVMFSRCCAVCGSSGPSVFPTASCKTFLSCGSVGCPKTVSSPIK